MKKIKEQKPTNPDTLTIYYKGSTGLPAESFKTNNPDKIISNRNALSIKKVNYGGKPFDISSHLKLYPEPKKPA